MTNKEKLEIIDKKLDELYYILKDKTRVFIKNDLINYTCTDITQAIYNLESTKLLLEPIENNYEFKPINMQ